MTTEPLRRLLGLARRAADPTDDAGLLARFAAAGDADAFELLVWRHGGMVLGVCRRVLGDEHAAEDAFQATFLALARQAKSVRRDGCVAGWLHRVARRVAQRAKASGERRASARRVYEDVSLSRRADARRSPDDPLAAAERRELSELLDEELDRLPERFRRPVVLCYLEGRSAAEAAERLGCPRGTVLSRLATAREKLRQRLLRRGVAPAFMTGTGITPPVIDGGLIRSTVRAVVGNVASPPVVELCDGVLKAMILSKLKLTAAVVMTVGLLGGGAGWVALTPGGPGVALAGPRLQHDEPKPEGVEAQRRQAEQQIEQVRKELAEAEDQLTAQEVKSVQERVEARLQALGMKDDYERMQKLLAAEPGNMSTHNRMVEVRRRMIEAEEAMSAKDRLAAVKRRGVQVRIEELQNRLAQFYGGGGRPDPTERKVQNLDRKLDDVLRELTELRRELKK